MDPSAVPEPRRTRDPLGLLAAATLVAAASLLLAATAGPPYLSLDELNPWLVGFAIGLFGALFATPFAIHHRLGGLLESDARWERALLWWGAVALAALALGVVLGLAGDFSSGSLAGSIGVVIFAEAALVIATLSVWLLSG